MGRREELPRAMQPLYPMTSINEEMSLFEGQGTLKVGERSIPGCCRVSLRWAFGAEAHFDFRASDQPDLPSELPVPGRGMIWCEDGGPTLKVLILESFMPLMREKGPSASFRGVVEDRADQVQREIDAVRFSLANFHKFFGKPISDDRRSWAGRARCGFGDWEVTVDSLADVTERCKKAERDRGFLLTHVGELRRADRRPFAWREASDCLEFLHYLFSFCRGFWVAPLLPACILEGRNVWAEYPQRRQERSRCVLSWFNTQWARGFTIAGEAWRRLQSEVWGTTIRHAIHWYVEANMCAGAVEGSLVLLQAAFEAIAWTYLVEDRRSLSEEGFRKLSSSDRNRLLCTDLKIPVAIPSGCPALKKVAKAMNWSDTAAALAGMRNIAVHTSGSVRKRLQLVEKHDNAFTEAWQVGLRNLELALLALFAYSDRYVNRLRTGGLITQAMEPVPWQAQ